MQKVVVQIHIAKEEHRQFTSSFAKPLEQSGIKYMIIVDKRPYNRNYPYYTVNNRMLCLKKTLHAARGRT